MTKRIMGEEEARLRCDLLTDAYRQSGQDIYAYVVQCAQGKGYAVLTIQGEAFDQILADFREPDDEVYLELLKAKRIMDPYAAENDRVWRAAVSRIDNDPDLAEYRDILLGDEWLGRYPDHMAWVATEDKEDLLDWCDTVRRGLDKLEPTEAGE